MMVKILECPMEFLLTEKDLTDTMTLLLLMGLNSKQSQSILVSIISFSLIQESLFLFYFGFWMGDILLWR